MQIVVDMVASNVEFAFSNKYRLQMLTSLVIIICSA